jgi:prolyl-tRNA editing enzyme YbaK/EbsC (Cys-tRNA(Pro) deacylase)
MKPAERVQAALDALELGIRVVEHEVSTATASDAASAAGCELGAIVKSLLFLVDGKPTLVLVAGDRMVDQRKLAAHFGISKKKVRLADSATVLDITGFETGGVPPVGHPARIQTLIDNSLARFESVWAAAGSPNTVFPIPFTLLVKITAGEVISLS